MSRHMCCAPISLLFGVLFATSAALCQDAQAAPPQAAGTNTGPLVHAPGTRAPEFTLQSVNGETVRLSDFRGQTVMIHFWATWCGPCKIMMPWLVDLQNKYSSRGFHVIAVALDENATKVEIGEFADRVRVNFPVLIGNEKVAKSYGGVPAMPLSVLVSQDGEIIETLVGLSSNSELERSVRKALNTRAAVDSGTANSQAQK